MGGAISPEVSGGGRALAAFSRTLEALYGGLMRHEPWEGFLLALRDAFVSEFATLILTPPGAVRPGQIHTPGAPPEQVERYAADFFTADPFTGFILAR